MRFSVPSRLAGFLAICLATPLFADEPAPAGGEAALSDKDIEEILGPIRKEHKVPGLIAGVVKPQGLAKVGAVGVRKLGSREPMTVNDKIHLGSNTKAMTATRLAMLVEEGKLSWTTTLGDVFAELKPQFHEDFAGVTVEQLLTHRAGLPANVAYFQFRNGSLMEQREAVLKSVLSERPEHPPGTEFLYSNLGYIIAGHIAEQLTGKPWEELMTSGLFEPLQMSSAGFGFPGTSDKVDQPWGHRSFLGIMVPVQFDNPALLGPAGTVHCSFGDWAKFVSLHMRDGQGEPKLLRPTTLDELHTPSMGKRYAMGWGVNELPNIDGPVLAHSGSNTVWFAVVVISMKHNVAFLVATNIGPDAGAKACDAALTALVALEGLSP